MNVNCAFACYHDRMAPSQIHLQGAVLLWSWPERKETTYAVTVAHQVYDKRRKRPQTNDAEPDVDWSVHWQTLSGC